PVAARDPYALDATGGRIRNMPEIDPGRNRESDPLALKWFQAEGRTIFVRPQDWEPEADVRSLTGVLLRDQGRTRDMAVLATLGQHHYLTTGHVEALFFTSPRGAQRRMRKLEEWGLATRWHQMEPPAEKGGWRRHCDVFLLTARGATVLAHYLRSEPRPLIKRAFSAFHYAFHLDHALGALDFFASLVHASRDLADQGLYHWLGDDGVRRALEESDPELAPDGWGRYLTAG